MHFSSIDTLVCHTGDGKPINYNQEEQKLDSI